MTTGQPTTLDVLHGARRLLAERGWTADGCGLALPEDGPLSLRDALVKTAVCPGESGKLRFFSESWEAAVEALCVALGVGQEWPLTALSLWQRADGRTLADVLALLDATVSRLAGAATCDAEARPSASASPAARTSHG